MLAWPLIHFCVFWVYVNANTFFIFLFHRFNPAYGVYEWVGFDRFADILHGIFVNPDAQIINFIKNSLTVFPLKNFYHVAFVARYGVLYVEKNAAIGNVSRNLLFAVYFCLSSYLLWRLNICLTRRSDRLMP